LTLTISAFEGSIQRDAKNATYHYHLGLAHIKNGDKEKARRALDQVLALNPRFEGLSAAQKALATL
jgi:Flp pilus assembly protein TadD